MASARRSRRVSHGAASARRGRVAAGRGLLPARAGAYCLLGTGPLREARLEGTAEALADPLADPLVHLNVHDKRRVFGRRKLGHLTVAGAATLEEALERERAALATLR